jgi:membrane-bound serine protease (ClpP class)
MITLFLVQTVIRSQRTKVLGGQEGLIGQITEVSKPISPAKKGKVFVHGEIWNAVSSESINKGEEATIVEVKGLTLIVERPKKEA